MPSGSFTPRSRLVRPVTLPGDEQGFNFTLHMRRLCENLAARLPELAHIDMSQVGIRFCQTRKAVPHGLHASLTPLRFAGGELYSHRRSGTWTVERLYDTSGRELLYLLSFYLPRYLERPFAEKLATVIHELWHIGPAFDGDLRRHPGRCYAHSHSQQQYDAHVGRLAEKWQTQVASESCEFLRHTFGELVREHGRVFGQKIATPKLVRAS